MKKLHILFLACLVFMTNACSKKDPNLFELPSLKTAVLPVFQPMNTTELIAGYFPEDRLLAEENQLKQIDNLIKSKISAVNPQIIYLDTIQEKEFIDKIEDTNIKGMLAYWVALGKHKEIELLILPQVAYYNSIPTTANKNTALMLDFFLIDTRNDGALLKRAHFAEEIQLDDDETEGMLSFSRSIEADNMDELLNDGIDSMIEILNLSANN